MRIRQRPGDSVIPCSWNGSVAGHGDHEEQGWTTQLALLLRRTEGATTAFSLINYHCRVGHIRHSAYTCSRHRSPIRYHASRASSLDFCLILVPFSSSFQPNRTLRFRAYSNLSIFSVPIELASFKSYRIIKGYSKINSTGTRGVDTLA